MKKLCLLFVLLFIVVGCTPPQENNDEPDPHVPETSIKLFDDKEFVINTEDTMAPSYLKYIKDKYGEAEVEVVKDLYYNHENPEALRDKEIIYGVEEIIININSEDAIQLNKELSKKKETMILSNEKFLVDEENVWSTLSLMDWFESEKFVSIQIFEYFFTPYSGNLRIENTFYTFEKGSGTLLKPSELLAELSIDQDEFVNKIKAEVSEMTYPPADDEGNPVDFELNLIPFYVGGIQVDQGLSNVGNNVLINIEDLNSMGVFEPQKLRINAIFKQYTEYYGSVNDSQHILEIDY